MEYENIKEAVFLSRPNRFIAEILVDGEKEICHVKNTGRCRELLTPMAKIYVEEFNKSTRKTKFDLIAVEKGERLINMDSQAPNKVVWEFLQSGDFIKNPTLIKPEQVFGDSRLDFYCETKNEKILIEVKGVTLEENGAALFPDAPTIRGVKHLFELSKAINEGYTCYAFFVIQMESISYFTPNYKTHREFGEALKSAQKAGVKLLAYDCEVTPHSLKIKSPVQISF
ncbi:MAG: DNA/RNA nuclease SfsA [Oscillospiraceae bacterium]